MDANDYNYQDQYQGPVEQQPTHKSSPAKAAVAQSKVRDNKGKFISGSEAQAYIANQQQQQFIQERSRMNNLLGKRDSNSMQQVPQGMPQQQSQSQNNFMNILQSSKSFNNNNSTNDKWDMLLGKKRMR